MMQPLTDLLPSPVSLLPLAHAGIMAALVGLACTVHPGLRPSLQGFWNRIAQFTLQYGVAGALIEMLVRGWFAGG